MDNSKKNDQQRQSVEKEEKNQQQDEQGGPDEDGRDDTEASALSFFTGFSQDQFFRARSTVKLMEVVDVDEERRKSMDEGDNDVVGKKDGGGGDDEDDDDDDDHRSIRATLSKDEVEKLLSNSDANAADGALIEGESDDESEEVEGGDMSGNNKAPQPRMKKKNNILCKLEHPRNAGGEYTVVAFVNSKSGGLMGEKVHSDLVRMLGDEYVMDLAKCKRGRMPEDVLLPYALDPKVRVLACGGDGTMGWIESAIDTVWTRILGHGRSVATTNYKHHLALAIMPLGTGNDLSRSFGWGPQYAKHMGTTEMINRVRTAVPQLLDRWRCVIIPDTKLDEEARNWIPDMLGSKVVDKQRESIFQNLPVSSAEQQKSAEQQQQQQQQQQQSAEHQKDGGETATPQSTPAQPPVVDEGSSEVLDGIFCNYLSIGFDAEVAFAFHKDRKENPDQYTSVTGNKVKYALKGLPIGSKAQRLRGKLKVLVCQQGSGETRSGDAIETLVPLTIPKACRAVALLNIQSYAGGNKIANSGQRDDGLIDVVFISTVYRLAAIGGVAKLLPFTRFRVAAQTSRVCIKTLEPLHCQVDGEPWLQGAATVNVRHFGRSAILERTRSAACALGCSGPAATTDGVVVDMGSTDKNNNNNKKQNNNNKTNGAVDTNGVDLAATTAPTMDTKDGDGDGPTLVASASSP